jgi:hypothetical protein
VKYARNAKLKRRIQVAETPLVKHAMVESIKIYRRTAGAAILGGAILLTSACSALPGESSTPTPEVTASPPASPAASPAASKPSSIPATLQRAGVEFTGRILSNSKGSYPEVTLNESSPLMKWSESKNNAEKGITAGWTKQDVEKAQQFASRFMLTKIIDGPANGDPSYANRWVKENKDLLHPQFRDDMVASATANGDDSLLVKESWHSEEGGNYGYVYDDSTPRIKALDISIDSSSNVSDRGMYFNYSGSYVMNTASDNGPSEQYTDVQNIGISVIKEGGEFYIAGVFHAMNTDAIPSR